MCSKEITKLLELFEKCAAHASDPFMDTVQYLK